MNTPLIKYLGLSSAILVGSGWLLWRSHEHGLNEKAQKIKDGAFRKVLSEIQTRLEHTEPSYETREDINYSLNQLRSMLMMYTAEHDSQEKYISPYVNQVDSLQDDRVPYKNKKQKMLEIIADLKRPI